MILEYHVLTRSSIDYASGKIYCATRSRNAAHSGNKTEANSVELSLRLVGLRLRDQTSTALLKARESPILESEVTELAMHLLGGVDYKGLLW